MSGFEFWEWPKNKGILLDSFLLVTSVTTPHLSNSITTKAELVLDSSSLYLPLTSLSLVLSKSNDDVLNASFTKFKFYVIFLFWNAMKWRYSCYSINCKFHHVSCYYALTIFRAQKSFVWFYFKVQFLPCLVVIEKQTLQFTDRDHHLVTSCIIGTASLQHWALNYFFGGMMSETWSWKSER